jgi:hypothetical protein
MKSSIVKGPIRLQVCNDKLFASTVGIVFKVFSIFYLKSMHRKSGEGNPFPKPQYYISNSTNFLKSLSLLLGKYYLSCLRYFKAKSKA